MLISRLNFFRFFSACMCIRYFINNYGIMGLKNVKIVASEAIKSGDSITLVCKYDLENAPLYSIKWYFGDNEFYRFVPKESPPTRVFPVPGIQVDVSLSDNTSVVLRDVQRDLTGYYKCEISADAPLFHTDIKTTLLVVIEEPESEPLLLTSKKKYTEGERIYANCTSRRAFPAANLTWFFNQKHISTNSSDKTLKINTSVFQELGGLQTSKSLIEMLLTSDSFVNGKLIIGCEASQFDLYKSQIIEIYLLEDKPQLAHVLSAAVNHASIIFARQNTATLFILWYIGHAYIYN